ncbi:YgjP-like metallopeptidase domain-containing protein [Mycoplasma buteonis]|uniref:YgjP-like metallopeptidase domain-containing protein n=1 Tax=Mycoplasma buteonis TaxID=171280 RepID=UPI00055F77DE|nr:YgjP-like metallopeptidase domain-containing protein [Mycoplasma buteonis]
MINKLKIQPLLYQHEKLSSFYENSNYYKIIINNQTLFFEVIPTLNKIYKIKNDVNIPKMYIHARKITDINWNDFELRNFLEKFAQKIINSQILMFNYFKYSFYFLGIPSYLDCNTWEIKSTISNEVFLEIKLSNSTFKQVAKESYDKVLLGHTLSWLEIEVLKNLHETIKDQVCNYVLNLLKTMQKEIENKYNIPSQKSKMRDKTTSYASHSKKTNTIIYSSALYCYDKFFLKSIVAHELAHVNTQGHGNDFKKELNRILE